MLITDKSQLQKYATAHRLWQGMPGIEITSKGRIFATLYSGGTKEMVGNFAVVIYSDDGGNTFTEPIAAAYKPEGRCYDAVLWMDPMGRLWFTWAYASATEESGVFGTICDDPDGDELVWSDVFFIGKYIMMNKPTVLSTGEWLFPIAVWDPKIKIYGLPPEDYGYPAEESGAFVYKSVDHQMTFVKMGGVRTQHRSCDEHMVAELKNGGLMMLIRAAYGIDVSYSYDQGHTWTEPVDSKIGSPSSRFFIRRLKSGRLLLVNHYQFNVRNNLTALLSEDDGKTWKYSLLLDERSNVSYPDAVEADDGYIYITYDRERGGFKSSLDAVMAEAREILLAKITEEDIIAGKLVSPDSRLKSVISKLGEYADDENPFQEVGRFTDIELAEALCSSEPDKVKGCTEIFDCYPVACENMGALDTKKLDSLYTQFVNGAEDKFSVALEIVRLIRSVSVDKADGIPMVEKVKKVLCDSIRENLSINQIADQLCISECYLMHTFKKQTGLTIGEYKHALRICQAKLLLKSSDKSVSEISALCGFESVAYFSKTFKKTEGVPPSEYREIQGPKKVSI